jgi:2-methylisocitrate lyase-like PEP mutase family enzyme
LEDAAMPTSQADKIEAFRALHESGCFPIPNPWDAGSARYLEVLGFKALASTSSGFANSLGRLDYGLTVDQVVAHLAVLTAAVDVPVNADFEGGFAVEPEGVAANVARAVTEGGVAGLSIEDRTERGSAEPLFELGLAVERIKAARAAIDATGLRAVLTARCEGLLLGVTDLPVIIGRLQAYAEAGADCLFAPGISGDEAVRTLCSALAPKPVNLIPALGWTIEHAAGLGARRLSVGGRLAQTAYGAAMQVAKGWLEGGTLERVTELAPPTPLGKVFG